MFAVVAVYKNGRRHLIGFADTVESVEELAEQFLSSNGAEALFEAGFAGINAELAG